MKTFWICFSLGFLPFGFGCTKNSDKDTDASGPKATENLKGDLANGLVAELKNTLPSTDEELMGGFKLPKVSAG